MSDIKFTQFPSAGASTTSDIIWAVQGGSDVQETLGQVIDLVRDNLIPSNAGDPNGSVAGDQYQPLWDTTNNFLWVCTITGSAASAVWKPCIGQATDGQIPIGRTGDSPLLATITPGFGVSVTNGPGSITLSMTGSVLPAIEVTTTSESMAINTVYIANNAAQVELLLPATAAVGDRIQVVGKGAGGWRITQAAGQQIHIGQNASTVGVAGYVESSAQYNSVQILCTIANTTWTNVGAPQGSLTIA